MTLPFSTKWPQHMGEWAGQPNYFVEKIWTGLISSGISSREEALYYSSNGARFHALGGHTPKLHTIRTGNRWRPGMKIHPVINNRTKNRFQFAPAIECVSVQEIAIEEKIMTVYDCIKLKDGRVYTVKVDGKYLPMYRITELAVNDGFESIEQFFAYFNKDFHGQIVHWTDLTY